MKKNLWTAKAASIIAAGVMILSLAACATSSSGTQAPAASSAPTQTSVASAETSNSTGTSGDYSSWPEKDVHVIYYTKAGSGGDIFLRQLAKALEGKMNGHSMIIENLVDPTGATAWSKVQKAEKDGYTLACLSSTVVTADLIGGSPVKYKDFDYAIGLGMDPQYIYCKSDKPYNNLAELVQYCKDHPGEVKWATAAPTSASTVCSVGIIAQAGIEVNRVVYDTGGDSLTAILGDFVDVSVGEYGDMAGSVEAGDLKLLTVLSKKRTSVDTVPTTSEEGFEFTFERPRGIAAPAGTDPALVQRIHEVFAQAYDDAAFQEYLASVAIDPVLQTGPEFLESYDMIAQTVSDNIGLLTGTSK